MSRKSTNSLFNIHNYLHYSPYSIIANLLVVLVMYTICRVEFVLQNWSMFGSSLTPSLCARMALGGLRFDIAAICYTNLPYLLLVMLPIHLKHGSRVLEKITKWVFIIVNSLAIIVNMMDSVYYQYSQRRTSMSIFTEFGNDKNMGEILGIEFVNHWYLVLLAAAMIYVMWRMYVNTVEMRPGDTLKRYYIRQSIILAFGVPIILMCMRGNTFFRINRPMSATMANEYVDQPLQTGIVLNTPYTMIRSSARQQLNVPQFFDSEEAMLAVYNPVYMPTDSVAPNHRNVVILLLESMAEEFVGEMYRPESGDTRERSLTPFIDSLYTQSLTWQQSFANGWLSVDGIPTVQASLPKMYNPYITSPYALNETPGIAKELSTMGYTCAYFHGADNASLGIKGSSRSTGFTEYFGMDEYLADERFEGRKAYDGTWGIWDEEFMQYMCVKLGELPQPFYATLFSVTSHHPFNLPEKYKDKFVDRDEHPVKKCIEYTDYAVRRFFESAAKQPWYDNTLFIILADHAYRKGVRHSYRNYAGWFRIPIIIFDPSGDLPRESRPGISQQIDIMPTLLNYLGYDKPYVSYGQDLLNTADEDTWAFQFEDFPQYFKGDYMIEMDSYKLSAVYRYKTDFRLEHNLLDSGDYDHAYVDRMVLETQAILQTIATRLRDNSLRQIKDERDE